MPIIESILSKLCRVQPSGKGWKALCPAHDDRQPSLSVTEGKDGRVLLNCFAGCSVEVVCRAMGITTAHLFPKRSGQKKEIVATYDYVNESGELLFQSVRRSPKDFLQRQPDSSETDGWRWNIEGVRRVLYRLPEVLAAVEEGKPVFVVEGEKDADALAKASLTATCNVGGAERWRNDYTEHLHGGHAVIIADKDGPGRKHAQKAAASLKGTAASVRVLELPDYNGKPVKDASDFLAAGGTSAEIEALAESTPEWTPPTGGETTSDDNFENITAAMRGRIIEILTSDVTATAKRQSVSGLVVETLAKIGSFYFHSDLRDFDSAMYFNSHTKRLEGIRSDAFRAWLSDWISVNRAETLYHHVLAAVETAALSSEHTTGIMPEAYWASRPGASYLSCGDGQMARITADGVSLVDNGTDGVLFPAGKTMAPWRLTEPVDPFAQCKLFSDAHCSAPHGQDLLRLWIYSLPTSPKSKPPLCLSGDVGAGKTRTAKGVAELFGIPFVAHKVDEKLESDFWPCCNAGGLFILDNADTRSRWLPDAIANAATDGCSQRRKLYTNAETVTLHARAWLALTTANPTFASDAGLADRLLLVRMGRQPGDTSDSELSAEIGRHRDGALSHVAHTLRAALSDKNPVPSGLNERHPDFAAFAIRIGRALGREPEAIAALKEAEADKATFCLENDTVASALLAYLSTTVEYSGTAADLVPHLVEVDSDLEGKLSAKRLGKRLSALWPHLQKALKTCHRESDRNKVTQFTFAGFAGFQTAFSEKSLREDLREDFCQNSKTNPANPADVPEQVWAVGKYPQDEFDDVLPKRKS